jgi:hypothetical protein
MASSPSLPICRVGYALNPKKLRRAVLAVAEGVDAGNKKEIVREKHIWRGGGLADILELPPDGSLEEELVEFLPWDPDVPVSEQPEFDVLIHKLTEDIDRVESLPKLHALEEYLKAHPKTIIVDPLSCVRKVVSRARTCEHLSSLQQRLGERCPFTQPKHLLVSSSHSDQDILDELQKRSINFPVICKPMEACGTPNSHSMVCIQHIFTVMEHATLKFCFTYSLGGSGLCSGCGAGPAAVRAAAVRGPRCALPQGLRPGAPGACACT